MLWSNFDWKILSKKVEKPTLTDFEKNLWPNLTFLSSMEIKMVTTSGLYYKTFNIVIYDRNAIGQYYKATIVDYDRS